MASLSVSIVADVADVKTKLALAQADLRSFTAETRKLADEMRTAGTAGPQHSIRGANATPEPPRMISGNCEIMRTPCAELHSQAWSDAVR